MNTGSFSVVVVVVAVDSLPRACTHVSTPDSFPERRLLLFIVPRTAADGPLTASMMAGVLVSMTCSKILMSPCLFLSEENSVFPVPSLHPADTGQAKSPHRTPALGSGRKSWRKELVTPSLVTPGDTTGCCCSFTF